MNVAQSIGNLRSEIDSARKETVSSAEAARIAARRHAEVVASQMTNKLAQKQDEQQRELARELNQIKSHSDLTTARLTDITSEVSNVRTEVASNRSSIDKTASELHRTTGDLGVMSGLIATNSKELAALRELGERDYIEFNLKKAAAPQKVGDILVQLKKSDAKRNRFTLEIVADDKRVEKKDRTINEPVQFYVVSKARLPYELVVNEVRKDVVVGYLAAPKVKIPARRL
jgi:chromosome segregation ATPase